jgi:adenosylhomocysteine nucleosidase
MKPIATPPDTASTRPRTAPTAIVAAMQQELQALLHALDDVHIERHAGRDFHLGHLHGRPVVLVLSRIGKVAAAITATLLIERFGVERMVFTGVAGGLGPAQVGDVVVARELLQHDMDASPLFRRHEVPLSGRSRFTVDVALADALADAARAVLADPHAAFGPEAAALGVTAPRLHQGLIISGDRFVATAPESRELAARLPDALAVEMEGAALAQVCHDCGVPFAVLRTVSDRADDSAHVDFMQFIDAVAARASASIVTHWLLADERVRG